MLFYGTSNNLKFLTNDTLVFNITSMIEGVPRLDLVPPKQLGYLIDRDFDIGYANYIMSNDYVFCNFFTIIYNLYLGKDIYLIYSDDDWSENLAESLDKLIQQTYGYNSVRINTYEDYIYAKNNLNCSFDPYYGIANLDKDKERYTYINESIRINNGGNIEME